MAVPQDKFKELDQKVKSLNNLMFLVVIVLFIGFAGTFIAATAMLVDSWREKHASYEQLENKVADQDKKVDMMLEKLGIPIPPSSQ